MAVKPELLGETLTRQYRLSCELFSTYPLAHFTHQLSQGSLDLHLDNIDLDHLEALCHSLKNKVSPLSLRVTVQTGKQVYPMVARVVERAIEGVGVCMVASRTISSLALDGVRLRGRTLKVLCEGLRKARTLQTLLVRNCGLGDSGTESMCQAVKNVPSITHLSLVNCGVTERGATSVACLIKHQRLNRDSAMWQDTLRQRQPHLDGMKGLRRLTLNSNPALGDQGVTAITEALSEDLWIKAVDLQHCGVGVGGGASFHALLHTNQTLEVVDLRNNPFLPDSVVGELTSLLQGRCSEATTQYSWLKTSEAEEEAMVDHHKRGGTAGYRASGRIMRARRGRQLSHVPTSRRPRPPSQLGVPWRVEHRLYERREGLAPGAMVRECIREWESVGEASQPSKELVPEEVNIKKMRKKLQHYKKKYQKEREHRQKLERKLSHIQTQLQGLHTLDESTVSHIEECFLKFHIFLSMMQNSGEQLHQSSPRTVSPSHHPPAELDSSQTHPGTSLLPGTFTSLSPSTIPVPVFIQQPLNASTCVSHPISAPHPLDSKQGGNMIPEQAADESELSIKNKDDAMNQKILRAVRNLEIASQGQTPCGSESEMQGNDGSRVNLEIMASDQYRKSPRFIQNQLESKKNRHERMMPDFSDGEHDKGIDKGMNITKIKRSRQKKEINRSSKGNDSVPSYSSSTSGKKQKQTVATQINNEILVWDLGEIKKAAVEQELISPSSADAVAMRVEFTEDKSGKVSDKWNNSKIKHTNGMNGKENQLLREDTQHEKEAPSREVSFKTSKAKEIHTLQEDQGLLEENLHEGRKTLEESCPSTARSEGSGASQSHHTTQSSSSQSPYESQLLKESYLPQQSPLPQSQLPQGDASTPKQQPQESQSYQQIPSYQESQSSGSQSPSTQSSPSQSPSSQSPKESHSPKRIQGPPSQSPQKVKSPQNWSPKKTHLLQRSQLPQRSKSPQKQSPKKSRSPKKELPEVQGNEVSETDDEKMRNLSLWLHGRPRGRTSTPSSSSSVSISEHLQQSHSSWTKRQGRHKGRQVEAAREEEEEVEELPGGSEIDLSDLDDLSLSGITLTNTSAPEDIHTPGEEDF